jgi:NAD(P)H-dependent flavin oxidoreductase YrpB (nitropropane dioxygenase family)
MTKPIFLAEMATISNATLAVAVSNAGGLGVIGGAFISPKKLQEEI